MVPFLLDLISVGPAPGIIKFKAYKTQTQLKIDVYIQSRGGLARTPHRPRAAAAAVQAGLSLFYLEGDWK